MAAALLSLSACTITANGPLYNEAGIKKTKEPLIVIYKNPSALGAAAGMYSVDINGEERCRLHTGSFFIPQNVSGNTLISSSMFGTPGTSKLRINTEHGKTYYVRIDVDSNKESAGMGAGLIGLLVAEAASDTAGPFVISLVDPEYAKMELQKLHKEESCK